MYAGMFSLVMINLIHNTKQRKLVLSSIVLVNILMCKPFMVYEIMLCDILKRKQTVENLVVKDSVVFNAKCCTFQCCVP